MLAGTPCASTTQGQTWSRDPEDQVTGEGPGGFRNQSRTWPNLQQAASPRDSFQKPLWRPRWAALATPRPPRGPRARQRKAGRRVGEQRRPGVRGPRTPRNAVPCPAQAWSLPAGTPGTRCDVSSTPASVCGRPGRPQPPLCEERTQEGQRASSQPKPRHACQNRRDRRESFRASPPCRTRTGSSHFQRTPPARKSSPAGSPACAGPRPREQRPRGGPAC